MNQTCIICGKQTFTDHSRLLIRCENCDLIRAREIPSDKKLASLYQEEYFFGKEYSDYKADRQALEYNFKKRIKALEPYLTKDTTLVEVGCAYGYFLNLIKDKVGKHTGYDLSVDGVKFGKKELGVNATNENFLTAKIPANSVDVICMWDVIEHLSDPKAFIAKARRILKPGGRIVITTGDIAGIIPRWRGDKWRMVHPPTHLYYFTPDTLGKLLANEGFEVVRVGHPTAWRNFGSVIKQIEYNQQAAKKNVGFIKSVDSLVEKTQLGKLNIPLNTFDIMEVTALAK